MVSRHAGHYVQIFKPLGPKDYYMPKHRRAKIDRQHPNYVEVEGRITSRTVTSYPEYAKDGWFYMSRELSRDDAIRYAKAYKRAGFASRVIFKGNGGEWNVTDSFAPKK